MIAALIEYFTDYDYDYKFYTMHRGLEFPLYEKIFIHIVFAIDMFIFFASIVSVLFFAALGIAWICGAQL